MDNCHIQALKYSHTKPLSTYLTAFAKISVIQYVYKHMHVHILFHYINTNKHLSVQSNKILCSCPYNVPFITAVR